MNQFFIVAHEVHGPNKGRCFLLVSRGFETLQAAEEYLRTVHADWHAFIVKRV